MNILKKMTVGVAVLSLAATPVMAEGSNIEYGIQVKADGAEVNLDYTLYMDADENMKLSAVLDVDENETNISMKLDDLLRGNKEHLYLNAGKVAGVIETLSGMSDIKSSLETFGISGDWVEVPLPECDKIVVEGETVTPGETSIPEISEELQTDLLAVVLPFMPEASGEDLVITVNDDKLIAAAGALDTVIANHTEEILGLSAGSTPTATVQNIDIKPAIEGYIDAVADGIVMANPDVTKEKAVETVNTMIDEFMAQAMKEAGSAHAGSTELTPEMLEQANCQAAVEEALKDVDVDGTIKLTEEGFSGKIVTTDESGTAEIMFETQEIENGYILHITSGEEEMVLSYTLTENEFTASVEIPAEKVSMYLVGTMNISEEFVSGSVSLIADVDGEEAAINGHFNSESAVEVDAIAMPEDAADGYEVVKNISAMFFAPAAEAEQPAE